MKGLKFSVFAAGLLLVVTGCKVIIQVPVGGEVVSQSGTYQCAPDQPCEIDVLDVTFNEVFEAVPGEGFLFDRWLKADAHLCGNTTDPCTLSTILFAGFQVLVDFLLTDAEFFLTPVFSFLPGEELSSYQGSWETTNTFPILTGSFTLRIEDLGDSLVGVTLQLGDIPGGTSSPAVQSAVARRLPNGDIVFNDNVNLGGYLEVLEFALKTDGTLTATIPRLPPEGTDRLVLEGNLTADAGDLEFILDSPTGGRIRATIRVNSE